MKNSIFKISRTAFFILVMIFLSFSWGENLESSALNKECDQQEEIEKAKIFRELYPLISETDLYCSISVFDGELLDTEIIGAEKEYERIQFNNDDIFYINKGRGDGLRIGQIFSILEIGPEVSNPFTGEDFGHLVLKRGRARIIALEEMRASASVEKACGRVTAGHFLVPFEEKEGLLGKDLGYNVPPHEGEGLKGMIIYLLRDYNQIGRGHWAIIDLGEDDGVRIGQQMIIYRRLQEGIPLKIIGNLIVIDTQRRTSTVKILSCKDAVRIGTLVQTRPQ